jgi:hypothetical protein
MIMKKILLSLLLLAAVVACDKEEKKLATVEIQAIAPDEAPDLNFTALKVTLRSAINASTYEGQLDASGKVSFTVDPGRYTATATGGSVSELGQTKNINGTANEFTLSEQGASVTIQLIVSTSSDLVFREIYFCGTKTELGANYIKDQYVELYNNSDHDVYLDGFCVGGAHPANSNAANGWYVDNPELPLTPLFQNAIWQFPGRGDEHKLAPGASCVLALNVKDHTADAPTSINLSGAHWAIYHESFTAQTAPPAGTPVMTRVSFSQGTAYAISIGSPAVVLFYLPMGAVNYLANEDEYYLTQPGVTSTTKYWHIRREWVIDGVECMNEANATKNHRLSPTIDAGYTYVTDGSYSNKAVRRKVKEVIDGRTVYQDTNNSTEDFERDVTPAPRTR